MLVITDSKLNVIITHCNFISVMESFLACHLLLIKINYKAVMLHCGKVDNHFMTGVELS